MSLPSSSALPSSSEETRRFASSVLTRAPTFSLAGKIVLAYLVLSIAWVVLTTDLGFSLPIAPELQALVNSYKGLGAVMMMAPLLYWFLRRSEDSLGREQNARLHATHKAQLDLTLAQVAGRLGTWTLELQSGQIQWSAALLELAGVKAATCCQHIDSLARVMPAEDFEHLERQRDLAQAEGVSINFVCRVTLPGALEPRHFSIASRLERDETGRPHRLVGTAQDVTEQVMARQALEAAQRQILASHRRLRAAFESAPLGVVIMLPNAKLTWVNVAALSILQRPEDELIGHVLADFLHPLDREEAETYRLDLLAGTIDYVPHERRFVRANGEVVWIRTHKNLVRTDAGEPYYFICMLDDISTERAYEAACEEQRAAGRLSSAVFEHSGEALGVLDNQLRCVTANKSFERTTGYSIEELVGLSSTELLADDPLNEDSLSAMTHSLASQGAWSGEVLGQRKSGEQYRQFLTITAVMDDNDRVAKYVIGATDLTEQQQLDSRLERVTRTDRLTGLPNQYALKEHLRRQTTDAVESGKDLGVVLLAYDHFHAINEALGAAESDTVLREAASWLTQSLESHYFVARYGGARFAVMPPTGTTKEALLELANHCKGLLQRRIVSASAVDLSLTVSAGLSLVNPKTAGSVSLLNQAESALVLQGLHERATLRFFSPDTSAIASRRMALENRLSRVGIEDELQVHFQPKWLIGSKTVVGAEALLRWQSPELGTVNPVEFIPIAEQTAMIGEIGRWVITTVVGHLARHRDVCPDLQVSVNLSGRQLADPTLPQFIAQTVKNARLDPSSLQFELTETWLAENAVSTRDFLSELRDLGFSVALDDFGVGYSSLSSVAQFTVDVVKLDRAFVEGLPDNDQSCVVASSVIDMARRLNIVTVAEGVETEAQRAFLERAGCVQAQGWLVAPALPADEFFARYGKPSAETEETMTV